MAKRPDPELRAVEAQVALTLTVDDFEAAARDVLPEMVFDYYAGGSGEEWTLRENTRAYGRWVIRPRVLVDVSNVEPMTTVLGQELPFPILLAPTAFQRMAHRDGELATAHGAASLGAIMVVSTIATVSLEDLAATGVRRWFQLYVLKDRGLTAALVKRAHAAGYEAIVLTVDTPLLGRRLRDERNSFALPPGIGLTMLFGVLGFFMRRYDLPIPPLVMGIILGPMAEQYFLTSMVAHANDVSVFVTRPVSAALLAISVVIVLWPVVKRLCQRSRPASAT